MERRLDAFGLREVAHPHPHERSGGQRQRTALARALAVQARALLLAALDTSAEGLGLAVGGTAVAIFKASSVIVGPPRRGAQPRRS